VPLTNAYRNHLAAASLGEAVTAYDAANARIAVGDASTAFAAGQTDLQGASKFRKAMDATYPQRTDNVMTFRATFATVEANFAWNEWAIFNAAAAGTMLNRKVEAVGTKTSAQSWQVTIGITLGVA
jgi:hypothetical protein